MGRPDKEPQAGGAPQTGAPPGGPLPRTSSGSPSQAGTLTPGRHREGRKLAPWWGPCAGLLKDPHRLNPHFPKLSLQAVRLEKSLEF